ncbi:hypothetical protein KDH_08380 [Dictyobacter sp. S3.2.2.5]|uniref:Uncharacterized protein n=1 Tax=Dictyobacter halimunensis TaxID=3026934 RepID=A0ABQ6FIL4_9CHLR|nr:hypothetical protein KDH_08380 [Dictyobacter sp. S3.2.2.5]
MQEVFFENGGYLITTCILQGILPIGYATRYPYFRRTEGRMNERSTHEKALGEGVDDFGWGL